MTGTTPNRILETSLYVNDLEAAESFYGGLLGLEKVIHENGRHVFFKCGQSMLLIFRSGATEQAMSDKSSVPPHGAKGRGHMCFAASSAEIEEYKDRFDAAGIGIEAELDWPNGGRSIYVRDPSGNSIEFTEPSIWPL